MAGRFRHAVLCLALTWSAPVFAGPRDVRLLPTQLERPPEAEPLAQRLEAALREALLDFGLSPLEPLATAPARDEESLVGLARESWVVSPELALQGSELRLRLSVVPPASSVVLVRVQRLEPSELEVRSLGMLRELVEQPAGLSREIGRASCRERV